MKSLRVPKSLTFSLSIPRNLTGPLNPQKIRQSRLQTPPKTSSSLWDLPALWPREADPLVASLFPPLSPEGHLSTPSLLLLTDT